MKSLLIAITMLIASFANAQFSEARLTAAGLTCAMCSRAIYNALEKIPFVDKVDADITNSAFVIKFKEKETVDPDQLKQAVEDAGFSVASLQLTGKFNQQEISKDAHVQIGGNTYHFLQTGKKVLDGVQTVTVVDKDYVANKKFKKLSASTDHPCVETGKAESCCKAAGVAHNGRIYHVTL